MPAPAALKQVVKTESERPHREFRHRLAALLEVLGVFAGGNLLSESIIKTLGVQSFEPLLAPAFRGQPPNFIHLSWVAFQNLMIQYTCLSALVFGIGWCHRRRGLPAYGVATGGHSLLYLMVGGVVLGALCAALFKPVTVASKHVNFGEGAQYWSLTVLFVVAGVLVVALCPRLVPVVAIGALGVALVLESLQKQEARHESASCI